MVDEERLQEWVKEKLEKGVSEDRIRESLKNTGHDPSIVDRVNDPFHDPSEQQSEREEMETGAGPENSLETNDRQEDSSSSNQPTENINSQQYSRSQDSGTEDKDGLFGRVKNSLSVPRPSLSMPSPSTPNNRYLKYGAIVFLLLITGIGLIYGLNLEAPENIGGKALNSASNTVNDVSSSVNSNGNQKNSGGSCPDVGVRIESAWTENGQTYAEVKVNRGTARVILEVYSSGELVGSRTDKFSGSNTLSVNAVGDKVVFRPVNCNSFKDSLSIG